jgi:hypothetical protein
VKAAVWAARFEKEVRRLQKELGLLDWCFVYERKRGDGSVSAEVNMSREAREAIFTIYLFEQTDKPERIAYHEVLHVLLYETLQEAAHRGDYLHKEVANQEHRAIERLVNHRHGPA